MIANGQSQFSNHYITIINHLAIIKNQPSLSIINQQICQSLVMILTYFSHSLAIMADFCVAPSGEPSHEMGVLSYG